MKGEKIYDVTFSSLENISQWSNQFPEKPLLIYGEN